MKRLSIALAAFALAGSAGAQTVIYDTFNEDDQAALFDCCNVWPISGINSEINQNGAAIPFTPQTDARIVEIDVPLSYFAGIDTAEVQLTGSTDGLPGRKKHRFKIKAVPPGGQCCAFLTLSATGVPVKAGGTYWVLVKAKSTAHSGWNMNSQAITGGLAIIDKNQGSWHMVEGILPAVRILSKD